MTATKTQRQPSRRALLAQLRSSSSAMDCIEKLAAAALEYAEANARKRPRSVEVRLAVTAREIAAATKCCEHFAHR